MDELTFAVLSYQRAGIAYKEVEDLVVLEIYRHLKERKAKDSDLTSEFILYFYPKIERMIRRFHDQGLPFRHYLLRTIKYQWTTFQRDRRREKLLHYVVGDSEPWTVEESPVMPEVEEEGVVCGVLQELLDRPGHLGAVARKRVLLLAFKSAVFLSDSRIEQICRKTDTDLAWLQACFYRIRFQLQPKLDRREELDERRRKAYSSSLEAQNEAWLELEPQLRETWLERARLYRKRMEGLKTEISSIHVAPSNLDLSVLLGLPKGSIDSGLFHLKHSLLKDLSAFVTVSALFFQDIADFLLV